jgi:hypothetical protein
MDFSSVDEIGDFEEIQRKRIRSHEEVFGCKERYSWIQGSVMIYSCTMSNSSAFFVYSHREPGGCIREEVD